jgi:hypothetical protein
VRRRNASISPDVYAAANRSRDSGSTEPGGGEIVQKAHPRDIGALALVVALFLVLFVLSVILGSPPR